MENILCLVACAASKRDERTVAYALYNSTLFEKSFGAACMLGDPYIMSAKHGILSVDDRIDSYNKTLRKCTADEKREWAESLEIPTGYDTVVLFGGQDYINPIKDVYNDEYTFIEPYSDTTGIGEQMAVAGEIIDRGGLE
jgi:hypothetical protein